MAFETQSADSRREKEKEAKLTLENILASILRLAGLERRSSKEDKAEEDYYRLAQTIYDNGEKLRFVDLNRPTAWQEEKRTKDYSIDKLRLAIDEVREELSKLKELLPFIHPELQKVAGDLILKADIYVAGHDEQKEELQRQIRSIRFKKEIPTKEMVRLAFNEGIEFLGEKEKPDILPSTEISPDEVRLIGRRMIA